MATDKRKIQEINAGSMADIAFLLLIFFLVATTMNVDTGLVRMLPPMPPDEKQQEDIKVKERNLFLVLISGSGNIMAGPSGKQEIIDLHQLKNRTKEFILNPMDDENLPEKVEKEIELSDGSKWMYPESQGVVSLQTTRDTGYQSYIMVQNELTPENIVERGEALTFPDSVVSYFKGMMGQPAWGFPEDLQKVVLKGEEPITCRPGELLEPIDFDKAREEVQKFYPEASERTVISWCLYPKVVEEFFRHRQEYGYIMRMGSHVFFNGMALGETNKINIEDGKTLVIKYLGLGDLNEDGTRNVHFELNGMRREVAVPDKRAEVKGKVVVLADPEDKSQVGSSIPGMVSKICVKLGDAVEENQVLAVIEAMKMETAITATASGTLQQVATAGALLQAGQVVARITTG